MVTKLADKRGQIAIKGHEITDEWESLVRFACKRQGQSLASFIVDCTRDRAQAIMKRDQQEPGEAIPPGLPVRLEDIADRIATTSEQVAALAAAQQARDAELRQEIARQARRGRWRR